jgi:hypothetical protein
MIEGRGPHLAEQQRMSANSNENRIRTQFNENKDDTARDLCWGEIEYVETRRLWEVWEGREEWRVSGGIIFQSISVCSKFRGILTLRNDSRKQIAAMRVDVGFITMEGINPTLALLVVSVCIPVTQSIVGRLDAFRRHPIPRQNGDKRDSVTQFQSPFNRIRFHDTGSSYETVLTADDCKNGD